MLDDLIHSDSVEAKPASTADSGIKSFVQELLTDYQRTMTTQTAGVVDLLKNPGAGVVELIFSPYSEESGKIAQAQIDAADKTVAQANLASDLGTVMPDTVCSISAAYCSISGNSIEAQLARARLDGALARVMDQFVKHIVGASKGLSLSQISSIELNSYGQTADQATSVANESVF